MTAFHQVTAIVGSPNKISKTRAIVESIVASIQSTTPIEVRWVEVADLAEHIGPVTDHKALPARAQEALQAIQRADLVIAASPVYKGTFTGLFKHLIDFLPPDGLVGKPVLLAASGGSDRHALVVDQQLRPLFSFFRALTIPSAVYAADADFDGYTVKSPALQARIKEAADQAASLLA